MGKTSTVQQVPTQQTTKNEPWGPSQPYLQKAMGAAGEQFDKGPQKYYPGSTVADLSSQTQAGLNGSFNFAQGAPSMAGFGMGQLAGKAMGMGQWNPGQGFNAMTAMGGNSNPFMQGAANKSNATTDTSGLQQVASQRTDTSALNPFATGQAGQNPMTGQFSQVAGQGASGPGTNLLTQVAGGGFLQNPYLNQAMGQAADTARNNVNSIFAAGGRYGSGAHQDAMAKSVGEAVNPFLLQAYQGNMADMMNAGGTLAGYEQQGLDRRLSAMGQDASLAENNIGRQFSAANSMVGFNQSDLARQQQGQAQLAGFGQGDNAQQLQALQLGGGLYNQDISNALSAYLGMAGVNQNANAQQMQALGMMPSMYQFGQQGFQDMQNVGANIDAYNQTKIDADVARHDFEQQAPWNNIAQLNAIAMGQGQLGGTQTMTGSQYFQRPTAFGSMLQMGGALGAAALSNPALFASDRRVKKDVDTLGTDPRGVPWYLFRYKWEDVDQPRHVGTMAQDLLKVAPEFVHADPETGIMLVDYAGLAAWEGPRLLEAA